MHRSKKMELEMELELAELLCDIRFDRNKAAESLARLSSTTEVVKTAVKRRLVIPTLALYAAYSRLTSSVLQLAADAVGAVAELTVVAPCKRATDDAYKEANAAWSGEYGEDPDDEYDEYGEADMESCFSHEQHRKAG